VVVERLGGMAICVLNVCLSVLRVVSKRKECQIRGSRVVGRSCCKKKTSQNSTAFLCEEWKKVDLYSERGVRGRERKVGR